MLFLLFQLTDLFQPEGQNGSGPKKSVCYFKNGDKQATFGSLLLLV